MGSAERPLPIIKATKITEKLLQNSTTETTTAAAAAAAAATVMVGNLPMISWHTCSLPPTVNHKLFCFSCYAARINYNK
jgi:hypothetical protein